MTRFPTRSSRRGKLKIKVLVLLLIALGLGAGGTYALFGRKAVASPAKGAAKDAKSRKASKPEKPLAYINLGAFLVNVVAEQGLRYLRVEVTVGVQEREIGKKKDGESEGGKAPALSPADDARARDAVVRVLSAQSYADVRTAGPSTELKQAVIEELRKAIRDVEVKDVMFTSFVMQ
jgi:flagellar basal body-associated protein FliL